MTGSDRHSSPTNDPLASQRAELLGKAVGAQFELERALAELGLQGGVALIRGQEQLRALRHLQQQVGTADAAGLSALRHDLAAALATAQSVAEHVRTTATGVAVGEAAEMAHLAAAAREQVMGIWRDMGRFGPLSFASAGGEEGYRRREAERQATVDAELAKGTPEGNLNAAGATIGQMADARAHGAGGPEFDQRWTELVETTGNLREAVRRRGGSTKEFDDRLRDDLRRIMQSKGLSDADIDARFAANADPLAAAKAYVAAEPDFQRMQNAAMNAAAPESSILPSSETAREPQMGDPWAKLRASGIVVAEMAAGGEYAHGAPSAKGKSLGAAPAIGS